MKLSEHFDLAEFTASDTAVRFGIDNSLPDELLPAALETAQMLERIRSMLGHPVVVSSGYRCRELNDAIGSKATSDHIRAMAADIKCPEFGSAHQLAKALAPHIVELGIGQLIYEFGSWVHVSTKIPAKAVNRVITIDRKGVRFGVQAG